MNENKKLRVIISGGGTGGHVFPALAIADAIKQEHPNTEFLFVGAKGKIEMEKVPAAGYKIEGLNIAGFQRKLSMRNLSFPFKLAGSMFNAYTIVRKFKPHVAVGVGGYASGPLLKVANLMNIPTLIQEQNSFPGITNRLLAGKANVICTAYENMERFFPPAKVKLTGNPVRSSILVSKAERTEAISHFNLELNKKTILVVGGSLGARTINHAVQHALRYLKSQTEVQLIWQTGKFYFEECEAAARDFNAIHVTKFIDRMDLAYKAADIIIARAGALTISELCLVGKPVILVPSPNVAEDHQMKNAIALAKKNAAIVIPDKDAEEELFSKAFDLIYDEALMKELSENIKHLAIYNAGERIAKEVLEIAD
ncbi:MAG: undecaprenyldiphospho-muramoylpentapeptide beta-N-acetylglucosaminyltransferase [Chitinophagales bacterium]|nr:undecaprenyldiphospho-muramoylpentapeptide beta-N-acetylglucosaminyltransferase [Chitinophagales bacterium]